MRVAAVGTALAAALLGLSAASVATGAVPVPPSDVLALLAGGVVDPVHAAVVTELRLPRLLLAGLVGASLATGGALLQGLFHNPLADPQLVGVSAGAALGAAAGAVLGAGTGIALPTAAFLGALAAAGVVSAAAASAERTADLLLAGIAVNALCGAGVGLLVFAADDAALRSFTFWTLGSVGGATWPTLSWVAPLVGLPLVASLGQARAMDALLLGDADAEALGVAVGRTRLVVVLLTAASVGAGVAACGTVAFVGLVCPHLARLVVGPSHAGLLPVSALAGAVLLVAADLLARTVVAPVELPLGVVTTAVGGPFLLWLLARRSRR